MYACQFFNRDKLREVSLSHVLSAYSVTTDATYSYSVTQDDIMFYPQDTYCLIMVTLGAMTFCTQGENNCLLTQGQTLVLKLRDIVSYKSRSDKLQYVYFNYTVSAQDLPQGKAFNTLTPIELIDFLIELGVSNAPSNVIDGLFATLCYMLKTAKTAQKSTLTIEPTEFIRQKLYFKLSNYDIATYCNISVRALTNMFKKLYNTTPQAYLFKLKIERAMTLLINSATPISEIAYMLSFNSPFHFSNRFKSFTGMSPTDYRKLHID